MQHVLDPAIITTTARTSIDEETSFAGDIRRDDLLGAVVDAYETVHEALAESVTWIYIVGLLVGGEPRVIEVRSDTAAGLMEGEDLGAVVVEVGIKTVESAGGVGETGEAIDATVIVGIAAVSPARIMIRRAWSVRQRAEIVVEGMIFLHDDDDVIDFFQAGLGERCVWRRGCYANK